MCCDPMIMSSVGMLMQPSRELSDEQLRLLDEASRIEPGSPQSFLEQVRQIVCGRTWPLIDDRRRRPDASPLDLGQ